MTAVTPHGTKVTGIAPMRTATPLPSSQSRVPEPDRIDKSSPESAASQPRIVTPAQRIQLARAVTAPPTRAMTLQLLGREAARVRAA